METRPLRTLSSLRNIEHAFSIMNPTNSCFFFQSIHSCCWFSIQIFDENLFFNPIKLTRKSPTEKRKDILKELHENVYLSVFHDVARCIIRRKDPGKHNSESITKQSRLDVPSSNPNTRDTAVCCFSLGL